MDRAASLPKITPLLTIEMIAKSSNVSSRTVRRWIDDGDLVAHHLGRLVRVSETDYQDFLRRKRTPI